MPEGVVFDLGYRPYEGERLGRGAAIRALYRDGVRRVFGVRRPAKRKIFPAVLIAIAVLPVLFYVAIGVVLGELGTDSFFNHPEYFDFSGGITMVFCALAASELIIPDRVNGVMAVYASRPLKSTDYVATRALSMSAVVFGFVWLPHILLLVGRAWTSSDGFGSYFVGHLDVLWETALATLVYLVAYGALAFLVAVFSSRPALAVFLYLVAFYSAVVTVEAIASAGYEIVGLFSVPDHAGYVKDWIMGSNTQEWLPEAAGYSPFVSLLAIIGIGVVTGFVVLHRYRTEL